MKKKQLSTNENIALWNEFRNGNHNNDAFKKLYELFIDDLYRYGYNLVRNKELVEDCLHELYLHLYNQRAQLGSTDNIRFYLYKALRRRITDTLKKLNKFDSEDYIFDNVDFLIQSYESQLIDEQLLDRKKQLVISELNKLPKRQKEILYLIYMKGLTYNQASEVMEITMKSVYNTVNIAIATLRNYLRESFKREGLLFLLLMTFDHYYKILF